MNTATAYLNRAIAARDAARALASDPAPRARLHVVRAFHLADYAARCADLADASGTNEDHALSARYYAADTERAATALQARRRALANLRQAVRADNRRGLEAALTSLLENLATPEDEWAMAERAYARLAALPAGRPAVHALSWRLARHLRLPEGEVAALAH